MGTEGGSSDADAEGPAQKITGLQISARDRNPEAGEAEKAQS
jgi:hypothetical protein